MTESGGKRLEPRKFEVEGRTVEVYPCGEPGRPVIYLNTFGGEGGRVLELARSAGAFNLAAVSNLDWNRDMSPWSIPPISEDDIPCTGGADEYLRITESEIVPRCESLMPPVSWRGIAGYSLAGLFAVYSLYNCNLFSRAASMSGSLWFPGFVEYAETRETRVKPDRVYFSLGDKESETRNPYLKPVRENTDRICRLFKERGAETVFELNPGNHYRDAERRTAAGILWILGNGGENQAGTAPVSHYNHAGENL